ncbi:MAG TPA: STAS domain-containing protein [Solirubrobacter sp.]|nr:STAS domain-containing protein [Solirubrobacter sp.]
MELEIDVDAIAGVLVVAVAGDVVRASLAKLREVLEKAMTGGRPVVVDLLDVGAFDMDGVRLLLDVHERLASRLRVVAERGGPVHQRLKEAGSAHVLALHRTRATALAAS